MTLSAVLMRKLLVLRANSMLFTAVALDACWLTRN
jgi:hypothetical protein